MTTLTNSINANSTTPQAPIQGGTGVSSPTAHGILIGEGASAVNSIVLTAGQVLIGTTASDPAGATLTAGAGISITSVSGSITITNTESGSSWSSVTTSTAMVANNGYFVGSVAPVAFTLPATAAIGDTFQVVGALGGWSIAQNSGQTITLGLGTTTTGAGGSLTSNDVTGDWIEIVCNIVNTGFMANMKQGSVVIV